MWMAGTGRRHQFEKMPNPPRLTKACLNYELYHIPCPTLLAEENVQSLMIFADERLSDKNFHREKKENTICVSTGRYFNELKPKPPIFCEFLPGT